VGKQFDDKDLTKEQQEEWVKRKESRKPPTGKTENCRGCNKVFDGVMSTDYTYSMDENVVGKVFYCNTCLVKRKFGV
jgi:hypothetical protein